MPRISAFFLVFRVVRPDTDANIADVRFRGFGAHTAGFSDSASYLTAAAGIGMTIQEVEHFLKRLEKTLSKSVMLNVLPDEKRVN